jgi:hypothetical protein
VGLIYNIRGKKCLSPGGGGWRGSLSIAIREKVKQGKINRKIHKRTDKTKMYEGGNRSYCGADGRRENILTEWGGGGLNPILYQWWSRKKIFIFFGIVQWFSVGSK